MKRALRSFALATLTLCGSLLAAIDVNAATVSVDPAAPWLGFMNVFETPQHGGAFVFGSSWGVADLRATFSGPTLTLAPNTINDPNAFWYTPSGGPGAVGNKIMDANMYVESTGPLAGQSVTFTGNVLANTLVGMLNQDGNGWTSVAFIKDFAPDYSSFNITTAPLSAGVFSINMTTVNDPARHVQYGFETIGPDVWATDAGPYGNIQLTSVPEPSVTGLLGLASVVSLAVRRRRN